MHADIVKKIDINTLNLYTHSCIELNLEAIPGVRAAFGSVGSNVRFADFSYPQ